MQWIHSYPNNQAGERFGDDFQYFDLDIVFLNSSSFDDEWSESVEGLCDHLQGQENEHRQPVEHVVDRGTTECTTELVLLLYLT